MLKILTKNGTEYRIYVDTDTKQLLFEGISRTIAITELKNISVGERPTIKGYFINPFTKAPQKSKGVYSLTTAEISDIISE